MTNYGMNSSLPIEERITAMVLTLISNVELTAEQKMAIRAKLTVPSGRPKAAYCIRGHARTPENIAKRSRRCRTCAREDNRAYKARQRVNPPSLKPRYQAAACSACKHARGLHGEDGYCYHKTSGHLDCECTGGAK